MHGRHYRGRDLRRPAVPAPWGRGILYALSAQSIRVRFPLACHATLVKIRFGIEEKLLKTCMEIPHLAKTAGAGMLAMRPADTGWNRRRHIPRKSGRSSGLQPRARVPARVPSLETAAALPPSSAAPPAFRRDFRRRSHQQDANTQVAYPKAAAFFFRQLLHRGVNAYV